MPALRQAQGAPPPPICHSSLREESLVCSPTEMISNGVNGILVSSADIEALAQSIFDVLATQQLKQRWYRNGKERSKDFSADVIASGYGKMFLLF